LIPGSDFRYSCNNFDFSSRFKNAHLDVFVRVKSPPRAPPAFNVVLTLNAAGYENERFLFSRKLPSKQTTTLNEGRYEGGS